MGVMPNRVHKYQAPTPSLGSLMSDEALLRSLASSIILCAVNDWIGLIYAEDVEKKKIKKPDEKPKRVYKPRETEVRRVDYDEIREFFHSGWGETVCDAIHLEPDVFIAKLERWLETYRTEGTLPQKIEGGP